MSRGVYRGVHSMLLDDVRFQRLSPEAHLVFLTLRICRDCGPACIFRYYPEVLVKQSGYRQTPEVVERALDELVQERWVQHDKKRFVIWIVNGLRHDPHIRLSDKKHLASVLRQLDGLPPSPLIAKFRKHYKLGDPSKGHRRPGAVSPSEKHSEAEKDTPFTPLWLRHRATTARLAVSPEIGAGIVPKTTIRPCSCSRR
jgi:hypothetical protein